MPSPHGLIVVPAVVLVLVVGLFGGWLDERVREWWTKRREDRS